MSITDQEGDVQLSQLDQLKKFTKVVADTGDSETIRDYKPQDATTNPSLIYAATQKQQYGHFLEEVLTDRETSQLRGEQQIEDIIDHLLVKFGYEILKIVPGRISTETDARLSFDVQGSINKARDQALRRSRHRPRTRANQNRVHVGRHQRSGAASEGRHQVQYDTAIFPSAGRPMRGSKGATYFAICWPDLRLV
jgi:hypothetical protein